ncbi:MAG: heme biosynthesis HemY N-terminal domain-containing protein [Halioglobus sp.]|nr:heme biosynthesis HemY N-terminal domain-containing protein [Halioglobus sp.]
MRKLFAVSLIALLLGVGVVALIETDPGYVLVSYGNYTLETSLWIGLVVLVVTVLLLYWLVAALYRLISGQRTLARWLGNRRSDSAHRNTTRGLIAYIEGNLERARSRLLRGASNSDTPVVNYLFAARASNQLGEPEYVAKYLGSAIENEPAAEVAVTITRAEISLGAGDYAKALAVLDPVRGSVSRYPRVLNLLKQAYEGLQDHEGLLALLPELRKRGQFADDELAQLERGIHAQRLHQADSARQLHDNWQALPAELRNDHDLVRLHVIRQMDLGDVRGAQKSILRALKREWDPELVRQYGLINSDDASRQLTQAERWLPEHPQDPQLLLCLGRLSLRDKLWGKAREYFESCYRVQPSAEVCAELGRLLLRLGEPKVAAAYYREGLAPQEASLPDLPLPDNTVADQRLLERSR